MVKVFLKRAFHSLWNNKFYSAINIAGLAIGMAGTILIFLWIQNELSYDRFYSKTNRILLLYNSNKVNGTFEVVRQTPTLMAPTLKQDFPEVEDATRVTNTTFLISVGEKHLNSSGAFVDTGFLNIFSLPLVNGDTSTALDNSYNIVITQTLARKLFGNEDVLGKIVRLDSNQNLKITGVIKDLPSNTSFKFDYLLPWSFQTRLGWEDHNWTNNYTNTYVLLRSNSLKGAFDSKVKDIIIEHSKGNAYASKAEVFTQPLSKAYLYSKSENGRLVAGRVEFVKLFSIIGYFILIIACINFMNLSTARSSKRAKEVGIRKVAGATRTELVIQFLGESLLLSLISFIIALIIVMFSLPYFNRLISKMLIIDYDNVSFWIFSVVFVFLTGLVAGSYPALYLSSLAPIKVLKSGSTKGFALGSVRKVLVVVQFSFATILIICTIIILDQLNYVQDRDTGYNKNHLMFTLAEGDADRNYELIKRELLKSGAAISVTRTANPITERWGSGSLYLWDGSTAEDNRLEFIQMGSDADLVKTMGLQLLEGRDINIYDHPSDTTAMVLNDAAVKAMRLKNPVGQIIRRTGYTEQWHVVGVIKDFILESPFERSIYPMVIKGPLYLFRVINLKLNAANSTAGNIAKVEAVFKKYNPQYPFEYFFVDQSYEEKFKEVKQTGAIALLFACLAIFVSCLGLIGLASYLAETRKKEIGVRKVLGASIFGVTFLLSKDFLKPVVIALCIASPIAWWAMHSWLQGFSYRIEIDWWIILGACFLTLFIALATVSFQSIKVASSNPVKSLRSE